MIELNTFHIICILETKIIINLTVIAVLYNLLTINNENKIKIDKIMFILYIYI